ncbi:hypothetical protein EHQ68_15490 [Leptospira congkakensis]|uniref:Uncharacterized protein n=1 Tax=Leptospira congkakensis TaxID=2484932 RepID=A0A4Z0ZZW1_9LEPT|nr:hypothetical protein [Leptospira congkakensis]TGL86700.1 hypothetical protein EHQ68_15490 [Leptospira congkakensis]TGL93755.1 hypothetical protein EHQ69_04540 [Leptospira congkakensis]TGL94839.1 hypothetical protein EHQ70_16255 [Leptospira congkakensis]
MTIKLVETKTRSRVAIAILLFTMTFLQFCIGTETTKSKGNDNLSLLRLFIGSNDQNSSLIVSDGTTVTSMINSIDGGSIQLGKELSFVIPPNSLDKDTEITIEKTGKADSNSQFKFFGQGYKFSPPGTQFAMDKPASLVITYDSSKISEQNLNLRSQQMFYYDEASKSYVGVPTSIDYTKGNLVAQVEHFTSYALFAIPSAAGNNSPLISLQSPVPAQIHADAPIYIRADVRDIDLDGSIIAVKLSYKKSTSASYTNEVAMQPENNISTSPTSRYVYLIPSTFYTNADKLAGTTLDIKIEAWDNKSLKSNSPIVTSYTVNRNCLPNTLRTNLTGIQNINVGFQRNLILSCRNEDTNSYLTGQYIIPEVVNAINNVGKLDKPGSTGTLFTATKSDYVSSGKIELKLLSSVSNSVTQNFTILPGNVQTLSLYETDSFGNKTALLSKTDEPQTISMKEGNVKYFALEGHDGYGNIVTYFPWLNADWNVPTNGDLGTLDRDTPTSLVVNLYTLDAKVGFSNLVASIADGTIQLTQTIQILARQLIDVRSNFNDASYPGVISFFSSAASITSDGDTAYFVFNHFQSASSSFNNKEQLSTYKFDRSSGLSTLPPIVSFTGQWQLQAVLNLSMTMAGPVPYVLYSTAPTYTGDASLANGDIKLYAKKYDSSSNTWLSVGSLINSELNGLNFSYSIGMNGTDPWVAYTAFRTNGTELPSTDYSIIVKRFNGTNWLPVGSSLTNNLPSKVNIQFDGSIPYVAFSERDTSSKMKLFVKKWNGASWISVGGELNLAPTTNASLHDFKIFGGKLYLSFDSDGKLNVKTFDGTNWLSVGSTNLNFTSSANVYTSNLEINPKGTIYLGWSETPVGSSSAIKYLGHFVGPNLKLDFLDNVVNGYVFDFSFIGANPYIAQTNGHRSWIRKYE